jgi:hypothetical protein
MVDRKAKEREQLLCRGGFAIAGHAHDLAFQPTYLYQ